MTSMVTVGTLEYWIIVTPPIVICCLTGPPLDAAGWVGATTAVGAGRGVGVSKTQAADTNAAATNAAKKLNFMFARIT